MINYYFVVFIAPVSDLSPTIDESDSTTERWSIAHFVTSFKPNHGWEMFIFYFLNSQSIPVYFRSQEKTSTKRSRVFDDGDDNGENGISLFSLFIGGNVWQGV